MGLEGSHLRLLADGGSEETGSALGPALGMAEVGPPLETRAAPGRPWDELAPWWLPEHPVVRRIAKTSGELGIVFDVAVAVTIERSLAMREIAVIEAELIAELDAHALSVRPRQAVGGAAAVYLRQLTGRRLRVASRLGPVSLPARVAARLAFVEDELVIALLDGDLGMAIAWERAAVLEARTIGEWASCQALMLLGAQAARPSAAPHPTEA